MQLPLIGRITADQHGLVVDAVNRLFRESSDARAPWLRMADDNLTIYTYGTLDTSTSRIVVNEIVNAVIAATDIQVREPPSITLEPVEIGDVPDVYWAGPDDVGIALGLPLSNVTPTAAGDVLIPPAALDRELADRLVEAANIGMMQVPQVDPATGQQVVAAVPIKTEWVVQVDDKLVADTLQSVFDVFWRRSDTERFVRSNVLANNIYGWQFALYEWDPDAKRHILTNLPPAQVYIDPTVEDIAEAAYAGVDLVVDEQFALRMYPHIEQAIREAATEGMPQDFDSNAVWGQSFDRDFQRRMVTMRVIWLRNQLIPLTPDEAVASGKVEQREIVEETVDESGAPVATSARVAYFVPGTDTPITEQDGDWPTRYAIRQLVCIGSGVAYDGECEHADIPLLHNVNIPLPNRPWGIGEPQRLYKLQEGRSRMVDALVEHCDFFRSPMVVMSRSMYNALPEQYKDGYVKAGMTLIVPDDQWRMSGGQVHNVIQPPETPQSLVQLQGILKQEITEQSGYTDVLQGRASSQLSGRAIEALQTAGASMIGFKSARTGDVVQRLAKLMLHSLVWRLDVNDVAKIISKYPIHILDAIWKRVQSLEWDVKVFVASGTGALLAQKKQEAIQQYQIGAMSLETLRERLQLDPQEEQQRQQKQMQQMQPAAVPAA